jgi:hypothetical protein
VLSFLWKVDSEENYDFLDFEVDEELQQRISGSTGWQRVEKILYGGSHFVSWSYEKDGVISSGADAGWLDKIENLSLLDSDGDGVPNIVDRFPENPLETVDTDGDGIGDNTDPYPNSLQTDIESEGSIQIPTSWGSDTLVEWKSFRNKEGSIQIYIKHREQPIEWILGLKNLDKLDQILTGELYALESRENQYWNYLKKSKAPALSFGNHESESLYFAKMKGEMTIISGDIEYDREQHIQIFFDGTSRWNIVCYISKEVATTAEREELEVVIGSVISDRIKSLDADSDGDGLSDFDESIYYGSSPEKIDSNLDGFSDGEIADLGGDPRYDFSGLVQLLKATPSRIDLFSALDVAAAEDSAKRLGQNIVTSNPSSFNLFTETEVSTAEAMARTLGQEDVTASPESYELATMAQVSAAAEAARAIVNLSARVALGEGEIVTPGFVVLGEQKKMLIRAVGPKLADLGVESPLPNPTMAVYKTRYDGNPPDLVATIDDWKTDNDNVAEIVSAMSFAGAFPLEPTETFQGRPFMTDDTSSAATLVTLDLGVYTVQVSSADDGVGEVLVEVYEITD